MNLRLLAHPFGILKLIPQQPFPTWLTQAAIFFVARTEDEYSIMCPHHVIPEDVPCSAGYRCLRVDGELAFDEIGVVARISKPLAEVGLSLFVVSTHDRDYVLIHEHDLDKAIACYEQVGLMVIR